MCLQWESLSSVVFQWGWLNRLPKETMECPFLEMVKTWLEQTSATCSRCLCLGQGGALATSRGPCQPQSLFVTVAQASWMQAAPQISSPWSTHPDLCTQMKQGMQFCGVAVRWTVEKLTHVLSQPGLCCVLVRSWAFMSHVFILNVIGHFHHPSSP